MTTIHNEQSKTLQWRAGTLKIFVKAFERYIELAKPYATEDNTELFQEFTDMQSFLRYFKEAIAKGDGEWDFIQLSFYGKNWGRILDVLWKYNSWKKQLFDEKDRITTIKAALEGDRKHLEEISEILQNPCWEWFNRHPILIPSFYGATPPPTKDPVVQQYFNVETLNGILTGTNNGTITQNNESKEVLKAIEKLASILKGGKINDQYTQEAFTNLQELQSELLKPYPDSSKMKKAADGLQVLSNFTQIGSFAIAVTPHLHTIQQFISQLPFPR